MLRNIRPYLVPALFLTLSACGGGGSGLEDPGAGDNPDNPGTQPPDTSSAKPTSLPAYSDLSLYSSDSPLNQKIAADAELDPNSDQYTALIAKAATDGGFIMELKQYSTPVYFADSSTPKQRVRLACGQDWAGVDSLSGVPIPAFAEPAQDIDGADNPIKKGQCGADADQDNQMVILDRATRCEYDFFQARFEDGRWVASWGNSISMDSRGIYEKGFSARGSGFTQLAGEIWPDELASGHIGHALIFSDPFTAAGGPVPPATESDGLNTEQWALPEGALVRLDPSIDLGTLNLEPYERTIAAALQEYGMYLVDNGTFGVSIEAIDPRSVQGNPYEGLLPNVDFPEMPNIPMDRLQVLKLPPQDPDFDSKSELVNSGCATFH